MWYATKLKTMIFIIFIAEKNQQRKNKHVLKVIILEIFCECEQIKA